MSASVTDSLGALNALANEAGKHDSLAHEYERAQKKLSEVRHSDIRSFSAWILLIGRDWSYGFDAEARDSLFEVLNESKHDLIRLAELRLAAKAREEKIRAAQKRAVVTASIIGIEVSK